MLLASVDNPLLTPDFGLFIWTTAIFCVFWFFVIKFAYNPIKSMLTVRNTEIQESLDEAEKARHEIANMKAENEKMIADARTQQAEILADAKATKAQIIEEAKVKAQEEADRIMANAKIEIENQKKSAINEVKNESSLIALNIAEQVIKRQLTSQQDQEQLANELIDNIKLS